jgi:hypothetical protein
MKARIAVIVYLLLFGIMGSVTMAAAGDVKQGDKVTIVTPGTMARLCPYPNCGQDQHITRIPKGTSLKVEGINDVKAGMMTVTWFEVTYKKKRGWISIYDTDKQ